MKTINNPWLVLQLPDGRRTAAPAAWTDLPAETFPPARNRPPLLAHALPPDGPVVPATPVGPIDPAPATGVTPDAYWALLPAADRERFGLRLSRLVLRAVRIPDPRTGEEA